MKREKKVWISLILVFILMMVLSGCSGVTGPKTAKINITINPNPVPYDSEAENWPLDIILDESNGVGVTLTSVRFDSYDQAEELYYTQFLYEEDIIDWFESNYIPAFSILQNDIVYGGTAKYTIVTVEGIDDNENPIEATARVDLLPQ